jgi:hypothetical protein
MSGKITMISKQLFAVTLLSVIVACGGGGSPGEKTPNELPDGANDPTPTEPEPDSESEPTPTEPEPTPNGVAPQAEILFPARISATDGSSITVRGTASDDAGIASVRVNGKEATVTASRTVADGFAKGSSGDQVVEWHVEVEVPSGDSELVVDVSDTTGEENIASATAQIRFNQVPSKFSFDTANQRLVGVVAGAPVDYRFATKTQEIFSSVNYPISYCFDAATDHLYYVDLISDDTYVFNRIELRSGAQPSTVHAQMRDPDIPEFTTELYCDLERGNLYFLVHHSVESGSIDSSSIYKISLGETPVWTTLFETDLQAASPIVVGLSPMAVADGAIIAHDIKSDAIIAISSATGSVETLYEEYLKFAPTIAAGSTTERIYVVHYYGIDVIDPANGTFTAVGYVTDSNSFAFSQIRSAVFDQANARILVGDSDLASIVAVDLNTGERSLALTSGIGDGPKLIAPRAIAVDSGRTKAYVLDDGGNAAEKVVEVDLNTGGRRSIGNINDDYNIWVAGIALDEVNDLVYAATQESIYRIDIVSCATETLFEVGTGSSVQFLSDMVLDSANSRLLLTDSGASAIFALDLETAQVSVVSKFGERGDGDAFAGLNGIALDPEGSAAYVTNQAPGTIQKVELESGHRTTLPIACEGFNEGNDNALMDITYNRSRNTLTVLRDQLTEVDLSDNSCTNSPRYSLLTSVAATTDNLLFGTDFGGLLLIDEQSFEHVTISR